MTRSTSTGLYTRLSNSFSQPVTGTTIDPTDADSYFDDIDEAMNSFIGTSTTSLAIATGAKTFTTQLTKAFLPGMFIQAFSQANVANYMYGTVTSYTAATGALVTNITSIGGSGTLADWLIITTGAQGVTGSTGPTGYTPGIRQAYSTTTADADPGAGTFRLNNATPASATAAYLDNLDSNGATVSTILDLFDDSTTTTKGFIRFEKSGDPTVWAQFAVTGSVVDGTGYRKLTLTSGAGSGAFTNADTFAISFYRSGDKGADGAGTGDFSSNTSTSVDGEIVLFSGTGGKTGKRATGSGLAKLTSGVLSTATSNTDYLPVASPVMTTPTLGVASATSINKMAITAPATSSTLAVADGKTATISNTLTLSGTDGSTLAVGSGGTLTGSSSSAIFYDNIPQNSKSAAYTTVLSDAQKHILHPSADTTARTFTIDSNANVAYPIGTAITFVNQNGAGVITIAITTDTMRLASAGTTGSRTLAANGVATALKITSTEWIISGTGLT